MQAKPGHCFADQFSPDKNSPLNVALHKQTKQQENPGLPFVCLLYFQFALRLNIVNACGN